MAARVKLWLIPKVAKRASLIRQFAPAGGGAIGGGGGGRGTGAPATGGLIELAPSLEPPQTYIVVARTVKADIHAYFGG